MTLGDPSSSSSARITFAQFESYCIDYLARRDQSHAAHSSLSWQTYAQAWQYDPPLHPGKAFESTAGLSRSFDFLIPSLFPSHDSIEDLEVTQEDPSLPDDPELSDTQLEPARQTISIHQTITHSPIWALPILHFHAALLSGEPVPLDQLTRLGVVHSLGSAPQQTDGMVAAISVGDHPRTGLPSYYLHPCNTASALEGLLSSDPRTEDGKEEERGWTYMSTFISLCASAVEMRAS